MGQSIESDADLMHLRARYNQDPSSVTDEEIRLALEYSERELARMSGTAKKEPKAKAKKEKPTLEDIFKEF